MYRITNSVMITGKSGALPGKDAQQSGGLLRDRHGEAHCMRVPGKYVEDEDTASCVIWLARSHGYL